MKQPAKPDRWERLLDRQAEDNDDWGAWVIPAHRVLHLLRAEHAATVRAVKRLMAHNEDTWIFKEEALGKVLAWLERRRR